MSRVHEQNQPEGGRLRTTPAQLFSAFSHERRQHLLAYLAQRPAAIPIGDLAEYVAIREGEPSYDRYERILTDLAHSHVPHLDDAGLVRYDAEAESVELAVERRVVAPYLALCGSPTRE